MCVCVCVCVCVLDGEESRVVSGRALVPVVVLTTKVL